MNRVCGFRGAALVAGLCMTFAQTTTVLAGGCDGDCGRGDLAEDEECAGDDYVDKVNGGCDADNNFIGIGNGGSFCGKSSTFLGPDVDMKGNPIPMRDTDWYRIDQASMMNQDKDGDGRVSIQTSLSSEFDGVTSIYDINNCAATVLIGEIGFSGSGCAGGASSSACVHWADHPDGIGIFVSTGEADGTPIFEGFECGTDLNDYVINVSVTDFPDGVCPPPVCGEKGAGECDEANGTPGCNDSDCCGIVCELEPTCCAVQWDSLCASTAAELCSLAPGCDAGGDTELTESVSLKVIPGFGIACAPDEITTFENRFARVYDLAVEIPGQALSVTCVGFGIEGNTNMVEVAAIANVYMDDDADPATDLVLMGATELIIGVATDAEVLQANFDPPVEIPPGRFLVVELSVPDLEGVTGIWPGSNNEGQSSPSYFASDACEFPVLTDVATIGCKGCDLMHWVSTVTGNTFSCVGDIDGDDDVDPGDLILLLGSWSVDPGSCPGCPADLDNDDDVDGGDLLLLLGAWGQCP